MSLRREKGVNRSAYVREREREGGGLRDKKKLDIIDKEGEGALKDK